MHPQDIGDTLAQVNVVRQAFGMQTLHELPYATMGDPAACLFYRALSDCGARGVHGMSISFENERQASLVAELWGVRHNGSQVATPKQIARTIGRFDSAEFPAYRMPGEGSTKYDDGPSYDDDGPSYEDDDEDN